MIKPEQKTEEITKAWLMDDRYLVRYEKGKGYPTLVAFVGIHGNEKASIKAVTDLMQEGSLHPDRLSGNVFIIRGNRRALALGRRFVDKDLNRIWTGENLALVRDIPEAQWPPVHELAELRELDGVISEIVAEYGQGELFFLDLHTTSAESGAFLPFNDSLANRQLAAKFPLPLILGIEEFLDGPLMSHINNLGYPALGFEAGRHESDTSVIRHRAFFILMLVQCRIHSLSPSRIFELERSLASSVTISPGFYEILHRHEVLPLDGFAMDLGFVNFMPVRKGQRLAADNTGTIVAKFGGRIFMPLYQTEGSDGFFIIEKVSSFWMHLSKWLRQLGFSKLITKLPGIRRDAVEANMFLADTRVARFLHREIFHLLGYRVKKGSSSRFLRLVRRD
ncbi:succinylglutamate desuccinylase/aspartoacylase domain-containing protein [Lunatimonas salinarum]|uniref:succinylglutamate desuccinylase/aspartoacylase domain-containing protein n=1 Tax=Lunatimonas salinarum TaxID=1774590 RepID=UPI001ADEFC4F|nr:succinylglutamate desuccinylase/aspartoacylase family protein [Lunatimonas salinarum]